MKTRRQFLQAATGMIALGGIPLGRCGLESESRYDRFAHAVNTPFEVELENGAKAVLVLAEARLQNTGPETENFQLLFRSASSVRLEQGTYSMGNRHIGRSDIFIVPGTGTSNPGYTAVFNCLKA